MPKLLSGSILRTGGSGEFIALPGAQPALLPTPSTATGYTLILDAQQRLSYSNSLGNLVFNSGTITTNLPNGNITLQTAGTGTIQVNSPAFFNDNVTFANTFTFVDITASGLIRFTNTQDSSVYNDGPVVISGAVGIAKTLNLGGTLNANTTSNFLGAVNLSPINQDVIIEPTLGGSVSIFPDTMGYIDNMVIGYNTPQDGWFNVLHVLSQFSIDSTATSYSSTSGALVVKGGVGIGGNVFAGPIYDQNKRVVSQVDITVGRGLSFIGTPTTTGTTVQYAITNTGVVSITAGTGTFINTSTGDVTIWTTGNTLQDVTYAGNSTTNTVLFRNTGTATSLTSASIVIDGGVAIGKNLIVGGSISASSFAGLGTFDRIAVTSSLANTTTLANNALYTVGGVGVGTDLTVFGNEYIYGSLTILGTFTTVVSQIADVGRKVVALSTSAGPAILAAESGITVGPIASPFAKFMFDGVSNWRSTGGINPVTNNTYNLGSASLNWKTIYAQNEYLYSTTTSVSTTTGALVVSGGVGISGSVYAGNIYDNGNRVITRFTAQAGTGLSGGGTITGAAGTFTFTNTGVLSILPGTGVQVSTSTGNVVVSIDLTANNLQTVTVNGNSTTNVIVIKNTTTATSTETGALIVAGGVGVGGTIFARGFKTADGSPLISVNDILVGSFITVGTDTAISTSSNVITIWNTSTLQSVTDRGNTTNHVILITNTQTSSNSSEGALVVSGGVGVGGNLNAGGNLRVVGRTTFTGPVTFNGTATFVYSTNTYYTDNLIELHVPETGAGTDWAFNDGKDIGVRFNYYSSIPGRAFLGRNNSNGYLEWLKSGNETGGATFAGSYGTFKAGSIELVDGTTSTSISSGALIVTGGAGIGGNLWVGGVINGTVTSANTVQVTATSVSSVHYINFTSGTSGYQQESVNQNLNYNPSTGLLSSPRIAVTSTQVASSTSTGAVVIAGGLGVGDSLYATNIYSNGSQVVTLATLGNYGVSALFAGTDTAVNTSTGAVTVWNTSTLHSVTSRGATTTNAIFVGSATATQVRTPEIYYPGILGIKATGNIVINTVNGTTTVGSDYANLIIPGSTGGDASFNNQNQSLVINPTFGAKIQTYSVGTGTQTWEFTQHGYTKFPNNTLQNDSALKINSGNGYVEFINDTTSTSTATGAVKILGGLGVGGNIYAANIYDRGNRVVTRVLPAGSTYIGVESVASTGTATSFVITNLGVLTLTAGTDTAVSSNTGTVTVWNTSTLNSVTSRGATTTNAIFVGTATTPQIITNIISSTGTLTVVPENGNGGVLINSNTTATTAGVGALKLDTGGAYIGHNLVVMGQDSSLVNTTTNAVYVAGGVHVGNNLTVRGPTLFADTVTFNGTATYVYSTNTVYTDNLIELHTPPGGVDTNWAFNDGKDIGFRFHYFGTTDTNAALVLANDTKELEWYGSGIELSTSSRFTNAIYGTFRTGAVKLLSGRQNLGNTSTGDLQVLGGVGIGGDVYINGNITSPGTIYGSVTNLAGGAAGSIPIQSNSSSTSFIPLGTVGYILTAGINTATWTSLSSIASNTSTNTLNVTVTTTNVSAVYYPTFVASTSGSHPIIVDANLNYNPNTDVFSLRGTTPSISTDSGALVVAGGVGIGGDLFVNNTSTLNVFTIGTTQRSLTFSEIVGHAGQNVNFIAPSGYQVSQASDLYSQLYWTNDLTNLNPASGNDNFVWAYTDSSGFIVGGGGDSSNLGLSWIRSDGSFNTYGPTNVNNTLTVTEDSKLADVYVGGAITVGTYSQYISYASRAFTGLDAGLSQNLDNWNTGTYRTAKYLLQATDTGVSPNRVHVSELVVFHNGSGSVYTSEYGITTNLGVLGTYDAIVNSGYVQMQFTPNATGLTPSNLIVSLTRLSLTG